MVDSHLDPDGHLGEVKLLNRYIYLRDFDIPETVNVDDQLDLDLDYLSVAEKFRGLEFDEQ